MRRSPVYSIALVPPEELNPTVAMAVAEIVVMATTERLAPSGWQIGGIQLVVTDELPEGVPDGS
jgi:hypothetical protein